MAKKKIFYDTTTLDKLNEGNKGSMIEHLGIRFTAISEEMLEATMSVDHRTKQPYGLLHGGASIALAETLASCGAALMLDNTSNMPVGLEINANHIKSVVGGLVIGRTKPIHVGKRTQVWAIEIFDEQGELISISRMTLAVIEKK